MLKTSHSWTSNCIYSNHRSQASAPVSTQPDSRDLRFKSIKHYNSILSDHFITCNLATTISVEYASRTCYQSKCDLHNSLPCTPPLHKKTVYILLAISIWARYYGTKEKISLLEMTQIMSII